MVFSAGPVRAVAVALGTVGLVWACKPGARMTSAATWSQPGSEEPEAGKGPLGPPPPLPPVAPAVTTAPPPKLKAQGCGEASFYGEGFEGKRTANGEVFNPAHLTAAHRSLPFGTRVRVVLKTNPPEAGLSGVSVDVRVNDHGPAILSRIIDLSEGAFAKLAPLGTGVIEVCLFELL